MVRGIMQWRSLVLILNIIPGGTVQKKPAFHKVEQSEHEAITEFHMYKKSLQILVRHAGYPEHILYNSQTKFDSSKFSYEYHFGLQVFRAKSS